MMLGIVFDNGNGVVCRPIIVDIEMPVLIGLS
jgi:hypothetical protein